MSGVLFIVFRNPFFNRINEAENRCASNEELIEILGRARAKLGMFEGDMEEGELEIGQVSGLINEIKPAAAIVNEIWDEFCATSRQPFYTPTQNIALK